MGRRCLATDFAEHLRPGFAGVEVEIARRGMAVLAGAFFRHRVIAALDHGNKFAGSLDMLSLDLFPVAGVFLRHRRFGERQGRIDPELAVVRRMFFFGLERDVLSRTAEDFLKHRHHRNQIVAGEFAAQPSDKFQ